MLEIEIKLRLTDAAAFRSVLIDRGWSPSPEVFERNTVFDTPARALYGTGRLLRIREIDKRAIVTVKLPSEYDGRHKVREEHQFETNGPAEASAVFEGLGYEPAWIYEKRRTTFRRLGEVGIIEVDVTPIGEFAEIEGEAKWIDRTAAEVGFSKEDYLLESYRDLFDAWRDEMDSSVIHMTFGD
jgi:predicted adenylyl cyclase CyaB